MGFFNLFKTKAEKRAYAIGRKHERQSCKAEKNIKVKQPKQPKVKQAKVKQPKVKRSSEVTVKQKKIPFGLKEMHKDYRENNLGALVYNGKIYDTNFKDGPREISKETLKELHEEYDFPGTATDFEVADQYVRHMRSKYGQYDKSGKWLGLLGDD